MCTYTAADEVAATSFGTVAGGRGMEKPARSGSTHESRTDYSGSMRRIWLSIALFSSFLNPVTAQENLWLHAANPNRKGVQKVTPPPSERQFVAKLLKKGIPPWGCEQDELLNRLSYSLMPLAATTRVLLVEAGPGCARGGQGSNGAMWLVASDGRNPSLLAGPEQGFDGFLYSVETASVKGYRDVVLGWHRGGGETGLAYFRFDGKVYRSVGGAVLRYDEDGIPKITPATPADQSALASGPSFDCTAAKTATEKLVCSDSELAALDSGMAYAYRRAQSVLLAEGKNALRNDQLAWLKAYARACDSEPSDVARKKCASQFLRSRTHQLSLGAPR